LIFENLKTIVRKEPDFHPWIPKRFGGRGEFSQEKGLPGELTKIKNTKKMERFHRCSLFKHRQ